MTIDEALTCATDAGLSVHDGWWILSDILEVSLGALRARRRETTLNDSEERQFRRALEAAASGQPLQYATGRAPFRCHTLRVSQGVFIPRPETEYMVENALGYITDGCRVVDLCTGSGAIALAIAKETSAEVWAVEKNPMTAEVARVNLEGTGVHLVVGDMADSLSELDGTVDVVISNPPYIPSEAILPATVMYEPGEALFAGDDGLDAIRVVASVASRLLREHGTVICEHDDTQAISALNVFRQIGLEGKDYCDLAGKPRFVIVGR